MPDGPLAHQFVVAKSFHVCPGFVSVDRNGPALDFVTAIGKIEFQITIFVKVL